jgi:hypothetical protein
VKKIVASVVFLTATLDRRKTAHQCGGGGSAAEDQRFLTHTRDHLSAREGKDRRSSGLIVEEERRLASDSYRKKPEALIRGTSTMSFTVQPTTGDPQPESENGGMDKKRQVQWRVDNKLQYRTKEKGN